ncbi:MAG: ABC transporter permease [Gammaproteobacteria bacterium]|nr:ABC transporter permease [Gammaproteobacteria bacterium]
MTPILHRASFGYLSRHPWQLALALLGICVGVAVIVAVDLVSESARRAFALSMDTINGEATHQIVAGPRGVDEALYTRLRVEMGMRNIAPVIEGYAQIANTTLRVLGVDIFAEREFRSYTFPDPVVKSNQTWRRLLTEPGAFVTSARTAASSGLAKGRQLTISIAGKAYPAILVGLIEKSASAAPGLDGLVIVDIAVAQHWLDKPGRLTRIDVRLPATESGAALANQIRAALPADAQLLSATGRTQAVAEMSNAFMTNLAAMSLLALLVGIFLIYNSMGFTVLQRRKLIGFLRALGVTRREIFLLILKEGLLLGLFGAALGVLFGILLGEQLLTLVSRSINDHYFVVNVTDLALSPASALKGLLAGLGVSLFAAAMPAWEAACYTPKLAMARSVLEHRARTLATRIACSGIVIVMLAFGVLAWSGDGLVAGFAALFLLVLGFAICIPLAVRQSARFIAPIASWLGGSTGRLAMSGVAASLSRTGVAMVALAVAVSAAIGVSVMVDSFRDSVSHWLNTTLRSDIYISAPGMSADRPGGQIDAALIADLLRVPGVTAHSATRRAWIESERGRTQIIGVEMAPESYAGVRLLEGEPDEAWLAFDTKGAVIVSDPYAYRHGVEPGQLLTLNTFTGERAFHVAGVYQSYDSNQGTILMSRATYMAHWSDTQIDSLGLYLTPDAQLADVLRQLRQISAGRQALLIRSNREIRDLSMEIFDRTFVITDVLYWLAVVVAFIGILSAMLAVQLENARELAILRAVGMTPGQLGGLVSMQTGFIGLLSGLAAIPLGLGMAWVLIDVINRRAFGWQMDMSISPQILLSAVALSVGAALLAGLYPAWRAAITPPALAMREE